MNKKVIISIFIGIIVIFIIIGNIINNNNSIATKNEILENQGIIALQEYVDKDTTYKITAEQYVNSPEAKRVLGYGIVTDRAMELMSDVANMDTEEWKSDYKEECNISIDINKTIENIDERILDEQAMEVHKLFLDLADKLIDVHNINMYYFSEGYESDGLLAQLDEYSIAAGECIDNLNKYLDENNIPHEQ